MAHKSSTLGEKLQDLRVAAGLTQQQLATEAGISLSTVSKLEEGAVTRPSARILIKIVGILKYDLDDLLSEKPLPAGLRATKAQPKLHTIKYVYFDVGGVLAHTENSVLQHLSVGLHHSIDEIRTIYYRYIAIVNRGKLTFEDLQYLLLLKLGVPFKGKARRNLFRDWLDYMEPNEPAHEFAKEVARRYPIGLITNISRGTLPGMFRHKLVPDLPYQATIESCEVGFIKPEKPIFEIATKAAGVSPESILLIDDRKINILGAREFGWQAAWFNELKTEASIERIRSQYF